VPATAIRVRAGAILPALWAVQHEQGPDSPPDAMTEIAGILQVTPSDVEAVSTFYSMYFQRPHGRHEVIVCINVSPARSAEPRKRRPPGAIAGLRQWRNHRRRRLHLVKHSGMPGRLRWRTHHASGPPLPREPHPLKEWTRS